MKTRIRLSTLIGLLAISSSALAQNIPGNVASAGLTTVVPDVLVWYSTNHNKLTGYNGYATNGPVVVGQQVDITSLGNHRWTPTVSYMGDTTFLIATCTFADDGSWDGSTNALATGVFGSGEPSTPPGMANQTEILLFQPMSGGTPRLDSLWYDDYGKPYRFHQVMRQKMGPAMAHVAGDKRPGGTNFLAASEANFFYVQLWFNTNIFNTDGRYSTNLPLFATGYPSGGNQDCDCCQPWPAPWCTLAAFPDGFEDLDGMSAIQAFSLNAATLVPKPLSKTQPGPYRNYTTNVPASSCNSILSCYSACPCGTNTANGDDNLGYLGGAVALDNGNYVNVVSDPSGFFNPYADTDPKAVGREDPVAQILAPDGSIVKDSWWVGGTNNFNNNVAAYSGGFCIRASHMFFFYDDDGNLLHTFNLATNNPVGFSGDNGNNSRLSSDIRSHYVYMAGPVGSVASSTAGYQVGVWDARTGQFLTNAFVNSDIGPLSAFGSGASDGGPDADLGVDELDRVCVAFEGVPTGTDGYYSQVMARVLQFNGTNFSYLTPTFFPFVNSDNTNSVEAVFGAAQGFNTITPAVAMTKDYICIAGNGIVNSTNNNLTAPDTGVLTLYTVITAPPGIPTAAQAGLSRIVPDNILWFNYVQDAFTQGPVLVNEVTNNSTIWDPYDTVLGDSTFIISTVTYTPTNNDWTSGVEAFALALQPTAGGASSLQPGFYADSAAPYLGPISTRKSGNPGRVVADRRFGANNFMYAAQATPDNQSLTGTAFQSNSGSRWTQGAANYSGTSQRYAVEQMFTLTNPPSLVETPLDLLFDYLGDYPQNGATTFGDILCLDNGNFAIIEDDSSGLVLPQEGAVFSIVSPTGTTIVPATAVDASLTAKIGLWANCAAYKGGFCVRYNATLYFFNDTGVLQGSVTQATSGLSFETTRGDTTRLASDIRSHYVYLAGAQVPPGAGTPVTGEPTIIAAWDARTMQFAGSAVVSSDIVPGPSTVLAANLAVDRLDRVAVAWDIVPSPAFGTTEANQTCYQIVARVMQFTGTNFTYLTPSFFPFINCDTTGALTSTNGLITEAPGVAMTTEAICFSGKGNVNSTNNPSAGADTMPPSEVSTYWNGKLDGVNFYTVLAHPAPVPPPQPAITVTPSGGNLMVSWDSDDGLFTVQTAPQVKSSGTAWVNFTPGNVLPPVNVPMTPGNKYIRLVRTY